MSAALDGAAVGRLCVYAVIAGAGAWCLARQLRLGARASTFAALAAVSTGVPLATWGAPAGHVAACLPWILFALERVRTESGVAHRVRAETGIAQRVRAETGIAQRMRAETGVAQRVRTETNVAHRVRAETGIAPRVRAAAAVACAAGAAVYGGDVATLVWAGLACVVWALAGARSARSVAWGLGALASGAALGLAARTPLLAPAEVVLPLAQVDVFALGLVLVCGALVLRWRALERRAGADDERARLAGFAGVVCALGAAFWICVQRGATSELTSAFRPWTAHASGGVLLASATSALALAALCEPRSVLTRGRVVTVLALLFAALAWNVPGLGDVWRALPLAVWAAPHTALPVAALFIALVAAGALEHARVRARRGAAVCLVVLALLAAFAAPAPESARVRPAPDADDELVGWITRPPMELTEGTPEPAFWLHPALRAEPRLFAIGLAADGADVPGARVEFVLERVAPPPDAPPESRVFRAQPLDERALAAGASGVDVWQVQLVLVGAGDELLGERCAGSFAAPPQVARDFANAAWIAFAALALVFLPRRGALAALAWIALLVAQSALLVGR